MTYTCDVAGNRLSINDLLAGLTTYGYDPTSRLADQTTGFLAHAYTYLHDSVDNTKRTAPAGA